MIVGRAHFDHAGDVTGGILDQSAIGTDSANGIMLTENDHWVNVINALGFDQEAGAAAPVKPIKSLQAAYAGPTPPKKSGRAQNHGSDAAKAVN